MLQSACVERVTLRAPPALHKPRASALLGERFNQTETYNMSEVTTSGETTVAPVETPSAPPAAAPTFGTSRGSGLSRGKRNSTPAPATAENKDATTGAYQPTAIQVVNHQHEYKNPFAPEPAPAAVVETPAKVEQPVASVSVPEEQVAPATPTPADVVAPAATPAPIEAFTPVQKTVMEPKAELKILPPEEKARPAQSWEIGGKSEQPTSANPRREGRPDFRPQRHEERQARNDARPARSDDRPARSEQPQEPRNEFRPREPRREQSSERREPFGERSQQFGERREQRTFEPKPTPAVAEAKKSGFLGWLKGLFAGDSAAQKEETSATPNQRQDQRPGEGRRYEGGNRGGQPYRGGRGRGGYRGDNRGGGNRQQFGSGPEGQSQNQGGPEQQGQGGEQRRYDEGNRGGGRRHHRGGRGRYRGDNRGGDQRPDSGGPTS